MKLVIIDWLDSHGGDGWRKLSQIKEDGESVRCRSVGWLLAEGNGYKVIVPHISGDDSNGIVSYGNGDLSIPETAIVDVRELTSP